MRAGRAPSRSSTSGAGGSSSSSRSGSGRSWSSSPPSCAPSPCARRRRARPPSGRAFSASEAAPPRVPDRPPGGGHAGGAARPGLHRAGPRSGVRRALPRHAARRRPALPLRGPTLAGARPLTPPPGPHPPLPRARPPPARTRPVRRGRARSAVAAPLAGGWAGRTGAPRAARIGGEFLPFSLGRGGSRGIARLDQLIDFQRSAADGRPFVVHVPRERLAEAPATPGVYHLLDREGRLLYVGKALRLRERLASYFTNARGHSARVLDLIPHTHDFRTTETGSALAAALPAARPIRALQPPSHRP